MVFGARALEGVKVAVVSEYETVPVTDVAPCFRIKVVAVSVSESIGVLKFAAIILLRAIPVASLAGSVEITVGETIAPVLKVHTYSACKALPITSLTDVATLPV